MNPTVQRMTEEQEMMLVVVEKMVMVETVVEMLEQVGV